MSSTNWRTGLKFSTKSAIEPASTKTVPELTEVRQPTRFPSRIEPPKSPVALSAENDRQKLCPTALPETSVYDVDRVFGLQKGGYLENLRSILETSINAPRLYKNLGYDFAKNLLITGPGGVGKSYATKAILKQFSNQGNGSKIQIFQPTVGNFFQGSGWSQDLTNKYFDCVKDSINANKDLGILILDNLELFFPNEATTHQDVDFGFLQSFLSIKKYLEEQSLFRIIIIGITEKPENVHDDVIKSFSKPIILPPPSEDNLVDYMMFKINSELARRLSKVLPTGQSIAQTLKITPKDVALYDEYAPYTKSRTEIKAKVVGMTSFRQVDLGVQKMIDKAIQQAFADKLFIRVPVDNDSGLYRFLSINSTTNPLNDFGRDDIGVLGGTKIPRIVSVIPEMIQEELEWVKDFKTAKDSSALLTNILEFPTNDAKFPFKYSNVFYGMKSSVTDDTETTKTINNNVNDAYENLYGILQQHSYFYGKRELVYTATLEQIRDFIEKSPAFNKQYMTDKKNPKALTTRVQLVDRDTHLPLLGQYFKTIKDVLTFVDKQIAVIELANYRRKLIGQHFVWWETVKEINEKTYRVVITATVQKDKADSQNFIKDTWENIYNALVGPNLDDEKKKLKDHQTEIVNFRTSMINFDKNADARYRIGYMDDVVYKYWPITGAELELILKSPNWKSDEPMSVLLISDKRPALIPEEFLNSPLFSVFNETVPDGLVTTTFPGNEFEPKTTSGYAVTENYREQPGLAEVATTLKFDLADM